MTIAAMILAGGMSRRMGTDKALLPISGVPLIRHIYHQAAACTDAVWVVTPWGDRYRPHLPPGARILPEAIPRDGVPAGPLVALAQALPQVEATWVLVLACDLPNLRASVLSQWQAGLSRVDSAVIAYLPRSPQGWEPLCGFYHRDRAMPSLQRCVATGERSLQRWLAGQTVQVIPTVDPAWLLNCNTPADWQRYGDSVTLGPVNAETDAHPAAETESKSPPHPDASSPVHKS
mgnify:CR=1 FL=1